MSRTKKTKLEVRIEPVKPDELKELADLASRTFKDAFGDGMDPEDLAKSLAENRSVAYFEKALSDSKILVAKHEGKIVGYLQYGVVKIPEAEATEDDLELGRLYIETDLQGRGLGRQLTDAALSDPDMAKAPNIFLQVWDENQKAISLYESYGFEKCGVTTFDLGGKPAQDLIMVRRQA
jgi:ribosomal protein S18 acetylase RimI-like enzyme